MVKLILCILSFTCLRFGAAGQEKHLSLNFGSGINISTPPGIKPDQSFNYGIHAQYYFLNREKFSFGLQYGVQMHRNTNITYILGEEYETTSNEFYQPLQVLARFTGTSNWITEIGIGFFASSYDFSPAASIGTGYILDLNDALSIPFKLRIDYSWGSDSLRPWDGVIPITLNAGLAYKFDLY